MAAKLGLRNISIHARKVFFTCRKSTTWDRRRYLRSVLRIFSTLKNPTTSVGIEPANLGSSGEHANH
jgi:hypothetical protein